VSSVGLDFNLLIHLFKCIVYTINNLAILTSNPIFPNRKGLEILEKIVPKKESSIRKFIIFKTPKKRMVKLCSKKKQLQKNVASKKGGES
jgi:hypothetical protein